jgi:hypothetical protein
METRIKSLRHASFVVLAVLAIGALAPARAGILSGMDSATWNDPPGRFMPGQYFEYKARFYARKNDLRAALEMYELSAYWANTLGAYNAGIMYYNGIGVPVDRVRGTAWLGIAAENHTDLTDGMLQQAWASLSSGERAQAEIVWHQLDQKYGDHVALDRALRRFGAEARMTTGSHVGYKGDLTVFEYGSNSDPLGVRGSKYYADRDKDRDALIAKLRGHVDVGDVVPLPIDDRATKAAAGKQ